MALIAFCGSAGAGKSAAALFLANLGYQPISYADSVKDVVASVFCWPRHLLDGITDESRLWREQVDEWWSDRLQIPGFTPRRALQVLGTEIFRSHFNRNIWVMNVERKISLAPSGTDFVIVDARFPNEFDLVRRLMGKVYEVKRGNRPDWYPTALTAMQGCANSRYDLQKLGVHESEYAWMRESISGTLHNNGTLEDLSEQVNALVQA